MPLGEAIGGGRGRAAADGTILALVAAVEHGVRWTRRDRDTRIMAGMVGSLVRSEDDDSWSVATAHRAKPRLAIGAAKQV